jgi:hypothetical protein
LAAECPAPGKTAIVRPAGELRYGPHAGGGGRIFAVLSEIEGLQVGLFADADDALDWLTEA